MDRPLSRRAVLAGGAGMVLLSACGSSGPKSATTSTAPAGHGNVLVALFDGAGSLVSGRPQRITFAIANQTGALLEKSPPSIQLTVARDGGSAIGPRTVARHNAGLPRSYYPFTFTPQAAGSYQVTAEVDGQRLTAAFTVGADEDVKIPGVGAPMPVVDTPTTSDHRGVDPICTRSPACPLHSVDLRQALAAKRPTALIIATPAYCQTAICGPVLDVVLHEYEAFPQITFIHSEVYDSAKDAEANGANAKLAPVLQALGMTFEPCLFLIGADGRVAQRIDVIVDEVELRQRLTEFSR